MKYLLGIDLGTTGLKASIFSLDGDLIGKGYTKNGYLSRPQGWAEQDPRTWWTGCCQAIQSALAESRIPPKSIGGIGICGFHHCPVFLDKDGEPARSTIVTHDIRLSESLEDLKQHGLVDEITKTSGSAVTTGHFPPIYHYVFHHDRQILERTRWILLAKDYIRFKLTGKSGSSAFTNPS